MAQLDFATLTKAQQEDVLGEIQRLGSSGAFTMPGAGASAAAQYQSAFTNLLSEVTKTMAEPREFYVPPAGSIDAPPSVTAGAVPPPSQPVKLKTPSGRVHQVMTLVDLSAALDNNESVIRNDGTTAVVQRFLGGYLVDGHPLNVVLGQGWIEGQWEALQPAIAAGQVPEPHLGFDVPVLPKVLWESTPIPGAPPAAGDPDNTLLLVGGAALGLLLLSRFFK